MKNNGLKLMVFMVLIALSCKSEINTGFKSITFKYQDSSVDPEWQRSYSIKVSGNDIDYIVRSYQDTLLNETFYLTPKQLDKIKSELAKLNESDFQDYTIKEPLMSGSSAQSIEIVYQNGKKLDAYCLSDSQKQLLPLIDVMKQLIKDNSKHPGKANYDPVFFKKIVTGKIKIDKSILADLKISFTRGAFHYDSIILSGNTLHHKLTNNSPRNKKTSFSIQLSDKKVIDFYNLLIEKGIYTIQKNNEENRSDASTSDMVLQFKNEKIKFHCSHFSVNCPITFIEEELIKLSQKELKRKFLPG